MPILPSNKYLKGTFMKVKKLAGFVLGMSMVAALASCGNGGNAEGQKKAIEKTLGGSIAVVTSSGNPLMANTEIELSGDSNDSLTLTSSQISNVDGSKYTVELTWSWDEAYNDAISALNDLDATHKKMEFNYPGSSATENTKVEFKVSAKCGSETGEAKFLVSLKPVSLIFDPMSIAELYSLNDAGTNFKFMNEETGKIKTNHGQSFYYIAISGKLIYKAPDSNWGLLADGEKVVQLYRLDSCSDNDKAVVGKYVTCYGEISNGYGNVQISYISKIEEMEDHSAIADPVELSPLAEGINDSASADFKTFYSGIGNGISSVTGTLKSAVTFNASTRCTFVLVVGSHEITIAYDYHTAKGDTSVSDAYKAIFSSATAGTALKIHGSVRWANNEGSSVISADGAWQLVPYLASDIALA